MKRNVFLKTVTIMIFLVASVQGGIAHAHAMPCEETSVSARDCEAARDFYNEGYDAYYQREYVLAVEYYSRAIKANPYYEKAYDARAIAYWQLGQYTQAVADYSRAIALEPNNAEVFYGRGYTYFDLRQYDRVIEDMTHAITIDRDYGDAYYNRGLAHYYLGQYAAALQNYNRAILLNPSGYMYAARGRIYSDLENDEQAMQDYTRAIHMSPGFADAYWGRGQAFYALGRIYYRNAIADYRTYERLTGALEPFMMPRIREMEAALESY